MKINTTNGFANFNLTLFVFNIAHLKFYYTVICPCSIYKINFNQKLQNTTIFSPNSDTFKPKLHYNSMQSWLKKTINTKQRPMYTAQAFPFLTL